MFSNSKIVILYFVFGFLIVFKDLSLASVIVLPSIRLDVISIVVVEIILLLSIVFFKRVIVFSFFAFF